MRIRDKTPVILIFFVSVVSLGLIIFAISNRQSFLRSSEQKTQESEGLLESSRRLVKLANEVQVNYFIKILGDPVFINYAKDRTQKEYIFVDKRFYLQAVTNSDDKVLAYSVTTRLKDFNPKVWAVPNEQKTPVVLGRTSLEELASINYGGPRKCYGFIGNTTPSFYFEEYYYGNPGNYQTYLFGLNDAGYWDWQAVGLEQINEAKLLERDIYHDVKERTIPVNLYDCGSIPNKLRKDLSINTTMVVGPFIDPKEIKFNLGINRNQVRLLGNN